MTQVVRRTIWTTTRVLHLAVTLLSGISGCGESDDERRDARAEVDAGEADAAAKLPARPLPKLAPSGLESIEVVTGGASPSEPLPLVIALHGSGDTPENFSKFFDGFDQKARFIFPRGPHKLEKGQGWIPSPSSNAMSNLSVQGSADKIAALVDEIEASKTTKGKTLVTGYSQGGLIAFVVAARQPERVDAVVTVNASLPRFTWPGEERFYGNRPVVRAFNGADDELPTAIEVQRCIVKLRMLKLDAVVRLYEKTGHSITPAVKADLWAMLSWLVAGTAEPSPCAPCLENSMDPSSCSLCPQGPLAPETKLVTKTKGRGQAAPQADGSAPNSPHSGSDALLGRKGLTSAFNKRSGSSGGSLSREEIQRTLRRNMASIRHCYEQQVARQPNLEGRVNVRFTIAPDGSVSSADIASSTLGDVGVEACIKRAVTRIRFPQPQGGSVVVTYPFTFAFTGH